MKIRKISIKNHPILGNLDLDFTDTAGKVYDTVVFAGENGTGKTSILNVLFDLVNINYQSRVSFDFIIELSFPNRNLDTYFQDYGSYLKNIKIEDISRMVIEKKSKIDFKGHVKNEFLIEFFKEDESLFSSVDANMLNWFKNTQKTYYLSAETMFDVSSVSNITGLDLDKNSQRHLKSNQNTMRNLSQLLVDIDTNDARDLSNWIDQHPEDVSPEDIRHKRTNRFNNAFKKIFKNLKFDRIVAESGKLNVLFSNGGKEVSLNNLSSGEKQIVFRGGFFLQDTTDISNEIAFIDEPELSLHPDWQKKILSYYREILTDGQDKAQLFIATHSPFVVHSKQENTKYIVLKKENNGAITVMNEPSFPDFTENKIVEEAFNVEWYKNTDKKIVFVEGDTDEKYLKRAMELFSISGFTIQWVGSNGKSGPIFTGDKGLNSLYNAFISNSNLLDRKKVVLFYDVDTNKKEEDNGNLFVMCAKENSNETIYKKGIENLLVLPSDFDREKFKEKREETKDYGEKTIIEFFKKEQLCDFLCSLSDEKLKPIFENLRVELVKMKTFFEKQK